MAADTEGKRKRGKGDRGQPGSAIVTFRISANLFRHLEYYAAGQLNELGDVMTAHEAARSLFMRAYSELRKETKNPQGPGTTLAGHRVVDDSDIEKRRTETRARLATKAPKEE